MSRWAERKRSNKSRLKQPLFEPSSPLKTQKHWPKNEVIQILFVLDCRIIRLCIDLYCKNPHVLDPLTQFIKLPSNKTIRWMSMLRYKCHTWCNETNNCLFDYLFKDVQKQSPATKWMERWDFGVVPNGGKNQKLAWGRLLGKICHWWDKIQVQYQSCTIFLMMALPRRQTSICKTCLFFS